MTDGFVITSSVFGVLGTLGGISGTISAVRATNGRRYVERGTGAADLLRALDSLAAQDADGSRFVLPESDVKLRSELSRVVRESAAVYTQQYPTPAGFEGARMLLPAYAVLAAVGAVLSFIAALAAAGSDRVGLLGAGTIYAFAALTCAAIAASLWERMERRNRARELSATPGRERYFESIHSIIQTIRQRSARKHTNF
ncbi:hypothetical protein GCM10009769_33560 [Curtobacterium luteum]|uniref:Uncharacterized protein n=1 Tax=Curtobacterium luteum TaxID=33881 RepID=A0A8H9GEN8_9MICO|nr:hypothetical protein GCM10009769_33560 [Curtobacterium luteum]